MPGMAGRGDGVILHTDEDIWKEYLSGLSQAEIATTHGVNQSTISRAITRYRDSLGKETIEAARKLDLARMDALLERHWHKAVRTGNIDSGKLVLGTLKLRARVLGLEAPVRIEGTVTVNVTVSDRLAQVRERNAARLAALPEPTTTVTRLDDVS